MSSEVPNKAWWKEAVVYQIYPRSFQDTTGNGLGDLKGITKRLDYLKELGINVVWLSPCYKSPNDDNGYDISDYRDIMDEFGTMKDWEEMLKGMHERGIKLVMDLVVNHSSDEHQWFKESRSSRDNPKRDYYIWRDGKNGGPPNNWTSFFSGPAWEYDEHTGQYYLHLFSKKQPDLNWDNPKLRDEVFDMMKFWFDKGVDGFRMDVISLISKVPGLPDGKPGDLIVGGENYSNGPHVHEYLQEMNRKVLSKYDCLTVGECPGVTVEEAQKYTNLDGSELNMVFQFDLMGVDAGPGTKFNLVPFDLVKFKKIQTHWQKGLEGRAWNSNYLSNHDQPRPVSRFGNDSTNELRKLSAKMLGTMNHTLQGTPYIYQGEELGMTNVPFESIDEFQDLEILNFWRETVLTGGMSKEDAMKGFLAKGRDNARTPMQWDASPNAGFTTGKPWLKVNPNYKTINAEESMKDPDSVFHYYQKLIQLRHQYDIIVYGTYEEYYPEDKNLYVYSRHLGSQTLFVALNFSNEIQKLQIPSQLNLSGSKLLISNYSNKESEIPTQLRPYEAIVYLK